MGGRLSIMQSFWSGSGVVLCALKGVLKKRVS